jgi:ribose 5-phosphate isomerase
MKTIKHEIKLERSVKIILGVLALGIFLNAFAIDDIISPAEASHARGGINAGVGSMHVTIDNWPR